MTLILDSYAHMYPKGYLKAVYELSPVPTVDYHLNNVRFYDPEIRVKILDKFKIARQVVNVAGGLPLHEPQSREERALTNSQKLARIANDETASMLDKAPERLVGIGNLPLANIGVALDELERCLRDLALKGICIRTADIPIRLDALDLDPIYEKMVKYNLPIFIHPSFGHYIREPEEFSLGITLGWPFETAMAMSRLVFGGVFQRFPEIKFVTHHAGSMIPYFKGRIANFYEAVVDGSEAALDGLFYGKKLDRNPIEYFKLYYNDTAVSGSSSSLSLAIEFFGVERILLGTDYPYGPKIGEGTIEYTLDSVEKLPIDEEAKDAILERNASKVFGLSL